MYGFNNYSYKHKQWSQRRRRYRLFPGENTHDCFAKNKRE